MDATFLLDMLAALGAATADSLWLPVLVWTALAAPVWWGLARSDAHPLLQYRVRQALLAALPMGVIAAAVVDTSGWWPDVHAWFVAEPAGSAGAAESIIGPLRGTAPTAGAPAPVWTWMHLVGSATLIAAMGALVGLGRLIADLVAFARLRREAALRPAPSIQEQARAVADRLGLRRTVQVRVTDRDVVPMTLTGWPATVVLPSRLTDTPDALRMTLLHECVHLRRHDDLAHVAERFVVALCAAHPLVRSLHRSIEHYREQACDAAVLHDRSIRPSSYARLLVAFADRAAASRPAALPLSETPSKLKRRLRAMTTSPSASRRWTAGIALTALLGLTLGIVACSDSLGPQSGASTAASDAPQAKSSEPVDPDEVYVIVEDEPECGGVQALQSKVEYPEFAKKAGIEGRVFVQFVVDETGEVVDPEVTRGVHQLLNQEALDAVQKMKCEPGRQRGQAVKVRMSLPVTFRLNGEASSEARSSSPNDVPLLLDKAGLGEYIQSIEIKKSDDRARVTVVVEPGTAEPIKSQIRDAFASVSTSVTIETP